MNFEIRYEVVKNIKELNYVNLRKINFDNLPQFESVSKCRFNTYADKRICIFDKNSTLYNYFQILKDNSDIRVDFGHRYIHLKILISKFIFFEIQTKLK